MLIKSIKLMNKYKKIDSHQVTYKTEELLEVSKNRYRITVQVANRAKRRKYEDIDIVEDPLVKPIIRAILEMVDEITQPEIIVD
uniref:DNA-directed RNA polymerase omega subunit n=1 Tax=Anunuuluaehu liula TaxID=3049639 RepID=UPI0030029FBA